MALLRMHVRLAGQPWDFLAGHLWPKRVSATNNRKFPIIFFRVVLGRPRKHPPKN
jgi:hypothetical protein